MELKNISIKGLTSIILVSLGAVVILLSIGSVMHFRDTAIESQTQSLSRIIEVVAKESMQDLVNLNSDLGTYTKKSRNFRKISGAAIKSPSDQQTKTDLAKLLDEQYNQRYVTSSIVDLKKIRIYDMNFTFIAQSNEGMSGLPRSLLQELFQKIKSRIGA